MNVNRILIESLFARHPLYTKNVAPVVEIKETNIHSYKNSYDHNDLKQVKPQEKESKAELKNSSINSSTNGMPFSSEALFERALHDRTLLGL